MKLVGSKKVEAGAYFGASFYLRGKSRLKYRILGKTKKIPSGVVCVTDAFSDAQAKQLKAEMAKVLDRLQDLNRIAGKLVEGQQLIDDEKDRLDTQRDEIIKILNPIWERFGQGKLPVPTTKKTWSEAHE